MLSVASSGQSLHLIISQLRMKYSSSNCLNHVRQTKSSINKRIIVRRTVWSMFGKQTLRPVKNELKMMAIHRYFQNSQPCTPTEESTYFRTDNGNSKAACAHQAAASGSGLHCFQPCSALNWLRKTGMMYPPTTVSPPPLWSFQLSVEMCGLEPSVNNGTLFSGKPTINNDALFSRK